MEAEEILTKYNRVWKNWPAGQLTAKQLTI